MASTKKETKKVVAEKATKKVSKTPAKQVVNEAPKAKKSKSTCSKCKVIAGVALKLARRLEAKKMTPVQLAKKSGVDAAVIVDFLNGVGSDITIKELIAIHKALGYSELRISHI